MYFGLIVKVHISCWAIWTNRARITLLFGRTGRAGGALGALLDVSVIDGVLSGDESSEYEEDDDPKSEVDGTVHLFINKYIAGLLEY